MKKAWFPIEIKLSDYSQVGRWYYKRCTDNGKLGQVFAIRKLRIILG